MDSLSNFNIGDIFKEFDFVKSIHFYEIIPHPYYEERLEKAKKSIHNLEDKIEIVEGCCSGEPKLKGRRITVEQILETVCSKQSDEELKRDFSLNDEDIDSCFLFASTKNSKLIPMMKKEFS